MKIVRYVTMPKKPKDTSPSFDDVRANYKANRATIRAFFHISMGLALLAAFLGRGTAMAVSLVTAAFFLTGLISMQRSYRRWVEEQVR